MLLMKKSYICYQLPKLCQWVQCEDQLTAKNMELSKGGLHVDVETFFTSFGFDLVIFLNLTENSSRHGSSAATVKKSSQLVEWKTLCDLYMLPYIPQIWVWKESQNGTLLFLCMTETCRGCCGS